MGSMISSFFQTGGHLLSPGTSKATQNAVLALLRDMREKEMSHIEWCHIERYISNIPKGENILSVRVKKWILFFTPKGPPLDLNLC
ncbi:hypothetical protein HNY73_014124 [Argiope bruennichi]|uniref:Uncharacterized protein n=1 Tax=Argiope bruennichi TaxID=94029 RepID=A0A8T0ES80_ARGBR|nr:hypothetical protein HNY73_014124 [Argiope bruennichi]